MNTNDINYTKEAFLNTWNLVYMAGAAGTTVGLSLIPGMPSWALSLMLVLTVGLELVYLGMMPRNPRFQRYVRSEKAAEKHKPPSQREIFGQLTNRSQRRYAKLRKIRDELQTNYRKLSYASQGLLDSHIQKIDGLLESYLDLLHQRERYRDFLDSATENSVVKNIRVLQNDMADDPDRVKSVKKRRLKVLKQRLARFHKARENLEIIGAQLGTIEDVVRYIHEQSWTMQNPQEVTMQLDTLLEEVEDTQASIREIEGVFSQSADAFDEDLMLDDDDLSLDDVDETLDDQLDAALDIDTSTPSEDAPSGRSRVKE